MIVADRAGGRARSFDDRHGIAKSSEGREVPPCFPVNLMDFRRRGGAETDARHFAVKQKKKESSRGVIGVTAIETGRLDNVAGINRTFFWTEENTLPFRFHGFCADAQTITAREHLFQSLIVFEPA